MTGEGVEAGDGGLVFGDLGLSCQADVAFVMYWLSLIIIMCWLSLAWLSRVRDVWVCVGRDA